MSFGYRFPPLPQGLDDRPSPPVPTTYLQVWIRLKERDYCLHRFQGNLYPLNLSEVKNSQTLEPKI